MILNKLVYCGASINHFRVVDTVFLDNTASMSASCRPMVIEQSLRFIFEEGLFKCFLMALSMHVARAMSRRGALSVVGLCPSLHVYRPEMACPILSL